MGKKCKGYGVGKNGRVKKGKRGHVLRVSGGENGRLRVGKRERVSDMVGKKGRTKGEKRGQGLKVGKRGKA